ncbi:MAG: N-acetylmuramoyl-L-alanine amidase [Nitrospirota bacterium]
MKKNIFLVIAFFALTISLFGETKTEILLRSSSKEGLIRIVLEADESFLKRTNAAVLSSQIKLEFPGSFNLAMPKDFPLEAVSKDKILLINLKDRGEVKILRLMSPPRLVIDIQTMEKQTSPILSKTFVIDPGHGGYDSGIIFQEFREKDISLNLAKDLSAALSKRGKRVFLTRKVDQYMSLIDRIGFVNQKNPDLFISLHSSMSENFVLNVPEVEDKGSNEISEIYSISSRQKKYIGKSKALSDNLGKAIKDDFQVNIVYREISLPILNSTGAPAVMIEFPAPGFAVYDQAMRARLIDSILNGISSYERSS